MSKQIVTDKPVCVTGASGFIAAHLVEQLLERGYRVRGTVRGSADKYPFLTELPGAKERLELVSADLTAEGAFDQAVAGCEYVMHTASPYALDVKDPQKDLVDPAVKGTTSVLEACKKTGTVKRVVLTSSMAAITDEPESEHVYTEVDWNDKSSLERNPYYYSKALAERAGWQFVAEHEPAFDLVVINPFLVIGPSHTKTVNPSNQVFADILGGTYPGIMSVSWGLVDVRDVARAHLLAMEQPDAKGRNICANATLSMREVVELMKSHGYGEGYKLPKLDLACSLGDFAVKLGSYFQPKGVGSYLRTHIGKVPRFDHSKIVRELGLEFRPLEQSIIETLSDLERWGHIPARKSAAPAGSSATV